MTLRSLGDDGKIEGPLAIRNIVTNSDEVVPLTHFLNWSFGQGAGVYYGKAQP